MIIDFDDKFKQNFYTIKEKDGTFTAVVAFKNCKSEFDANFILNAIMTELSLIAEQEQKTRTIH